VPFGHSAHASKTDRQTGRQTDRQTEDKKVTLIVEHYIVTLS